MKFIRKFTFLFIFVGLIAFSAYAANAKDGDPLPSWNEGPAKKAILEFVAAVTDENGKHYAPPTERIATWLDLPPYNRSIS